MRVIAGCAKGHRLKAPKGMGTRPVLDQVKESMFNILFDVNGKRALDLFAGTGAVGIEALSRGVVHCTFVENNRAALECLHTNLEHCRLQEFAIVIPTVVAHAFKRNLLVGPFDLIFVDPPYEQGLINPTLEMVASSGCLATNGRIIIEHHPHELIEPPSEIILTDQRRYGQTRVSFLRFS